MTTVKRFKSSRAKPHLERWLGDREVLQEGDTHAPNGEAVRADRCQALHESGKQCGGLRVKDGSLFCWHHDPREKWEEARGDVAEKLARPLNQLVIPEIHTRSDLREVVQVLLQMVAKGHIDSETNRQLTDHLKLIEKTLPKEADTETNKGTALEQLRGILSSPD